MRSLYLTLLGLTLLLSGCPNPIEEPDLRPTYRPLLMSRDQLEKAVAGLPPQALHQPGKIFRDSRYLYVNELYQGIHIFDNIDPAKPVAVGFVRIPGNVDMAVRGTLLYADNGPDLLTLDISDPAHAQLVSRTRDALPELLTPVLNSKMPEEYLATNRPADAIVVGWEKI